MQKVPGGNICLYLCLCSFFHIQILVFFFPFPMLFHCLCKGLTHYAFHPPVISDSLLVSNPCFCTTPSVLFTSHSLDLLSPQVCLLSIQLPVLSHSVFIPLCVCPTLCMPRTICVPACVRVPHVYTTPCVSRICILLPLCPTPQVSYCVCVPHSARIPLVYVPLMCVPLRMCPAPCVSQFVCPTPCVSHPVSFRLYVSLNPQLSPTPCVSKSLRLPLPVSPTPSMCSTAYQVCPAPYSIPCAFHSVREHPASYTVLLMLVRTQNFSNKLFISDSPR